DRLSGDHADSLTDADRASTREVASVAARAHAIARVAGDRRTDRKLIHALMLNPANQLLIEKRVLRNQHLLVSGLQDLLREHTSEHSLTQRLDDVTALDERSHVEAIGGTAVNLGHDQVVSHVDQAARQIA